MMSTEPNEKGQAGTDVMGTRRESAPAPNDGLSSGGDTRVTVIGAGMLGSALARAFMAAGHATTVWNRSAGKADDLIANGAIRATTIGEAIAASPLIVICVSDYDAVRDGRDPRGHGRRRGGEHRGYRVPAVRDRLAHRRRLVPTRHRPAGRRPCLRGRRRHPRNPSAADQPSDRRERAARHRRRTPRVHRDHHRTRDRRWPRDRQLRTDHRALHAAAVTAGQLARIHGDNS